MKLFKILFILLLGIAGLVVAVAFDFLNYTTRLKKQLENK